MVTAGLPACLDEYCPFPCLPFVRRKSSKKLTLAKRRGEQCLPQRTDWPRGLRHQPSDPAQWPAL